MNRFAYAALLATTLALAGCESINNFDPTELIPDDPFGNKKKLTGERKPVFPEGVPGMARGVPPELLRDQQPGSDVAQDPRTQPQRAAVEEQPKPKARPKAKAAPKPETQPETAANPSTPTSVTVRRSPSPSPFPDPPPTGQQQPPPAAAPWPGEARGQGGGVQWPDPPAPGR